MHKLLPALVLSCFSIIAQAQRAGTTDSTFGNDGIVTDSFTAVTTSGARETTFKVLTRGGGRFFCLGDTSYGPNAAIAMRAYLPNGIIDPSFNGGNTKYYIVDPYTYGMDAAMAPDGKIVISGFAGYSHNDLLCLRLRADGEIDSSYGTDGHVRIPPGTGFDFLYGSRIKLQPDGRAVIAGYEAEYSGSSQYGVVVRLNADGSKDMSFNSSGIRTNVFGKNGSNISDLAILQSGNIALVGDYLGTTTDRTIVTMRLKTDGSTDTTFGTKGMVQQNFGTIANYGYSIVEQKDKKLVMGAGVRDAGASTPDLFLFRYNADGSLDNTWGLAGITKTHFTPGQVRSLLDVSSGNLLVGSRYNNSGSYAYAVARFNNDGTPDNTFGDNGIDTIYIRHGGMSITPAPADMAVDLYTKSVIISGNGTKINLIKVRLVSNLYVSNVHAIIDEVNFYPNPVSAEGHLRFSLSKACAPYITLQDVSGRVVQILNTSSLQAGNHELSIDMSRLMQGTYFVNSTIGSECTTMKLIKE